MNMNQDFDWLIKVIESSRNKFHLESSKILIEFFKEKHLPENAERPKAEATDFYWKLVDKLNEQTDRLCL